MCKILYNILEFHISIYPLLLEKLDSYSYNIIGLKYFLRVICSTHQM